MAAVRQLVLSIFEERLYGLYPYSVTGFSEGAQTVDGRPLRGSGRLPAVAGLPIRTARQQLRIRTGEQIVVAFEGGDPAFPFVVSYDHAAAYAGALPTARQGDIAMLGGNGFMALFTPNSPSPFVPFGVPVFISFGSLTSLPTPPPVQSPGYAVLTTGSLEVRTR